MAMDTSTVRLVIFLGMFLMFAGDYSYVIFTIFGRSSQQNNTEPVKSLEDPASKVPGDGVALTTVKKDNEKENGKE